jgi:nitrous oxide reductase accessory protein NosL
MKNSIIPFLCAAFLLVTVSVAAVAENIRCAECGMTSDLASKYTARIVLSSKTLYFCDIGDLLVYLNKEKEQKASAGVKDLETGEWLEARTAYYVHDGKKLRSPMGWGIAAFKARKQASAYGAIMDLDAALGAVR